MPGKPIDIHRFILNDKNQIGNTQKRFSERMLPQAAGFVILNCENFGDFDDFSIVFLV